MKHVFSPHIQASMDSFASGIGKLGSLTYFGKRETPGVSDFMFGDPQEMPIPDLVEAFHKWTAPQSADWFGYKFSIESAQKVAAEALQKRTGVDYRTENVQMTTGAMAGLAVSISTLAGPGDEVIFISPPWFGYEPMIYAAGATPVSVKIDMETFDLDINAIEGAISGSTRAIIVNTPNNPTGKVYPPETLGRLSGVLAEASERNGRPVYLISDESYSDIVLDGGRHVSPTAYYPYSVLVYTYGKRLLTPGHRMGYLAVPPNMQDSDQVSRALNSASIVMGYAFPSNLLQYAIEDIEKLSIDIDQIQRRRDTLLSELRRMGYQVHTPEGTFYLMVRSPIEDDLEFCEILAKHDVLVLPGASFDMPGYFRLSLTANDEMVKNSVAGFEAAIGEAVSK